jgi:hypothetical protein
MLMAAAKPLERVVSGRKVAQAAFEIKGIGPNGLWEVSSYTRAYNVRVLLRD